MSVYPTRIHFPSKHKPSILQKESGGVSLRAGLYAASPPTALSGGTAGYYYAPLHAPLCSAAPIPHAEHCVKKEWMGVSNNWAIHILLFSAENIRTRNGKRNYSY